MEKFNQDKFDELIVYIAERSNDDPQFGKVKLLKLLAYADFEAYVRLGHSITGVRYQKLPYGPAPRDAPSTLERLTATRVLALSERRVGLHMQIHYAARRKANTSVFTEDELALVDEILARFARLGSKAISNRSHRDFVGWDLVAEHEDIPYSTALLSDEEPSENSLEQGRQILAALAPRAG